MTQPTLTDPAITLAHTIADHEAMRTAARNKAYDTVTLAGDARHALLCGQTEVVAEFLDRIIQYAADGVFILRPLD